MPVQSSLLTILAPGLLDPQPDLARLASAEQPAVPALCRLLGRADWQRQERASWTQRLLQLLGFEPAVCERPPLAAITAQHDGIDIRGKVVMRADPVHLQLDIDRALMADEKRLQLDEAEADALLASLNAHFADDGLRFVRGQAMRWYLLLEAMPAVRTTDITQVRGDNVHDHMPAGEDYRCWRSRLNEAQMLLHAHEVNQRREAAGLPTANSVWFWGEGSLPAAPAARWDRVYSDDDTIRAVAAFCGIDPAPVQAFRPTALSGRQLLVLDDMRIPGRSRDVLAWSERLQHHERHLFAPLLQALGQGRHWHLHIDAHNGRLARLDKRALRRFWRRKALDKLLDNP